MVGKRLFGAGAGAKKGFKRVRGEGRLIDRPKWKYQQAGDGFNHFLITVLTSVYAEFGLDLLIEGVYVGLGADCHLCF